MMSCCSDTKNGFEVGAVQWLNAATEAKEAPHTRSNDTKDFIMVEFRLKTSYAMTLTPDGRLEGTGEKENSSSLFSPLRLLSASHLLYYWYRIPIRKSKISSTSPNAQRVTYSFKFQRSSTHSTFSIHNHDDEISSIVAATRRSSQSCCSIVCAVFILSLHEQREHNR